MTGYIKKGQKLVLASFIAMLLIFLFSSSACVCIPEGSLGMIGTVYEWTDAPAGAVSKIYIEYVVPDSDVKPTLKEMQENFTSDISTVPLGDVKIAIGLKEAIEKMGEEYYNLETDSATGGNFDDSWVTIPTRVQYLVKANKLGYIEAVGETEDVGLGTLVIIVIMVKDNK